MLRRLAARWNSVVVPRCVEGSSSTSLSSAEKLAGAAALAAEAGDGTGADASDSNPSVPPRGAFALHLAEARAYAGLMDIEDQRLAAAYVAGLYVYAAFLLFNLTSVLM